MRCFYKSGAKLQHGVGHMASDSRKKFKKNAFCSDFCQKGQKRAQKRDRDRANEMRRSRRGHIIILYTQRVPIKIRRREGKWQKMAFYAY